LRFAAEFQKYIDHFGMVKNAPIGMLGRLGLARACAMQGDATKARAPRIRISSRPGKTPIPLFRS
jgi:hypothetical protein